jgi:uroporphyrinogen decarboxylase
MADAKKLFVPDMASELGYVMDAVSTIRKDLKGSVPLIGFSGSPWTLATYMVEGGSSKTFAKIKAMMFDQPATLHHMLDVLADSVIAYLNAQIQSGAQAVQIFDTWGGVLTPRDYNEFSLRYMHKIVDGLIRDYDGRKVPVILFTKGGGQWLEAMADTGADALGLDWTINIDEARARVGDRVALQGNMDPCILYASPARIREEVASILAQYGHGTGHVFNLGHGIHPEINPEHAGAFITAVTELSGQYHK